jgi:hypothetical protein
MTGAAISIDDASAADTIWSVKERVFAANRTFPERRQRLMYRAGPHGINPLANDETLGGAGVARDGTAVIDVLLADLTAAERNTLGLQVWLFLGAPLMTDSPRCSFSSSIGIYNVHATQYIEFVLFYWSYVS